MLGKGKLVCGSMFNSKGKDGKEDKTFAIICFELSESPADLVSENGKFYQSYLCDSMRLPCELSKMLGKTYVFDCSRNFVNSFIESK